MIVLIILLVVVILGLIFCCVGENGYKHKCIKANSCPASVRCSNEKEMECYEDKL